MSTSPPRTPTQREITTAHLPGRVDPRGGLKSNLQQVPTWTSTASWRCTRSRRKSWSANGLSLRTTSKWAMTGRFTWRVDCGEGRVQMKGRASRTRPACPPHVTPQVHNVLAACEGQLSPHALAGRQWLNRPGPDPTRQRLDPASPCGYPVATGDTMPTVGVRELKNNATKIVRAVREDHAQYVVTVDGRPVAVLRPYTAADEAARLDDGVNEAIARLRDIVADVAEHSIPGVSGVEALRAEREARWPS